MAITPVRSVVTGSFVARLATAASSASAATEPTKSFDGAVKLDFSSALQSGTAIFAQSLQRLNAGISYLATTKDTLEKLGKVVDKVVTLAQKASESSTNSSERANLDTEFRRLGNQFRKIVASADFAGKNLNDSEDVKTVLKTIGLDEDQSSEVSAIFSRFILAKGDSSLASEKTKGTRPIRLPEETEEITTSTTGTFAAAVSYDVGATSAQSIAIADFDNDSILDLVVADKTGATTGEFRIAYGAGDGSFGASVSVFDATNNPIDIAVADFNTDGLLDVGYSTDESGGKIYTQVNDGLGGFSSSRISTSGYEGTEFGNIDGQNGDDVVVAELGANDFLSALNDGVGNLNAGGGVGIVSGARDVALADFDNNGALDLAVVGSGGYYFSSGDNSGTFSGLVTVASNAGSEIFASDLDGDLNQDLIVGTAGGSIYVQYGDGTGSFGAVQTVSSGANVDDIRAEDFNGDGYKDIVAASSSEGTVNVFLSNGDGTYAARTSYAVGAGVRSVQIGDIDGDGRKDILASSPVDGKIYRLLGEASGSSTETTTARRTVGDDVNLFATEQNLRNRGDAIVVLTDAKALKDAIKRNLKTVDDTIQRIIDDKILIAKTGTAFLELESGASGKLTADQIAEKIRDRIRSKGAGSLRDAQDLDPIVSATLAGLSAQSE